LLNSPHSRLSCYRDASISAAKAAGGITEVAHIDYSAHSILGVVADFCTIVKGK